MKRSLTRRALALLLCLCLLPALAFAQEKDPNETNDGTPVTRSDFTLQLQLYADGFPRDGAAHYEDWQTFLDKLSLRGVIDTQSFLKPLSRAYFHGGLYLNDKCAVPFDYDSYNSYRYIRSAALGGASVHFQMHNFFEFMLKGYYFMDLPTPLIAVLMYPEATCDIVIQNYYEPVAELVGGGEEYVSYDELYELCETLDMVALESDYDRGYFYFTSLLIELGASDLALEKLSNLEGWLDYLDPEREGMTITREGGVETYTLGAHRLLEKRAGVGGEFLTLTLPDEEGYELRLTWQRTPAAVATKLSVTLEGEERLSVGLSVNGLSDTGSAEGDAVITLGGAAIEEISPMRFRYSLTQQELPGMARFTLTWLHPQTGKPAMGVVYEGNVSMQPYTVLKERPYDNKEDFFHLNEEVMGRFKEQFIPPMLLTAIPIVLEMPAGALNDTVKFLTETGILAFLGVE